MLPDAHSHSHKKNQTKNQIKSKSKTKNQKSYTLKCENMCPMEGPGETSQRWKLLISSIHDSNSSKNNANSAELKIENNKNLLDLLDLPGKKKWIWHITNTVTFAGFV